MIRNCTLFLLIACLLASSHALGWGGPGHAVIGNLAERQLSPAALAEVRRLLIDEPKPTLAAVANWADGIREDPAWQWTIPMHWVTFADSRCREVLPAACKQGLCVDRAVQRFRDDLANRELSRAQRAQALKFVVHFVGDVHQPLHASYRSDQGGNDFQISIDGTGTNLHAVWDRRVLGIEWTDVDSATERLQLTGRHRATGNPRSWSRESCQLVDALSLYPAKPGRLPKDYLLRMRPHAEQRIQQAAARLAALLEEALVPQN
ncbi:MAG: S1/P1 nuclease [Pseudomarimonas sp.]